jgi:Fe-S cluster biogenesis protein NfuA
MLDQIEKILDIKVRPHLTSHYGNVQVVDYEDNILKIKLIGMCSNCPSSTYTVENIVERELMENIPEIKKVVLVNEVSEDLLDFARRILRNEDRV